jgi:cytidylate kinase
MKRKIPDNFAIGALSAGGKTTVGQELLATLSRDYPPLDGEEPWQVIDLGDIARARAKELGQTIEAEASGRPGEVDLAIEDAARAAFRRGRSVVLGRLPWMVASEPEFFMGVFRVWLHAAPEVRANRRTIQKGGVYQEILRDVRGRDDSDATRYNCLYPAVQFPPGEPFDALDFVVSAEKYRQDDIVARIAECGRLLVTCGPGSYLKVQL